MSRKHVPTAANYAAGLMQQEKRNRRFWLAYLNASAKGTWINEMLDLANNLSTKSSKGISLFNAAVTDAK